MSAEHFARIATALERQNESLDIWMGMIHSDLETLMYSVAFMVPPIIYSQPDIPAGQKNEMVGKVLELLEVHRKQMAEITKWREANAQKD